MLALKHAVEATCGVRFNSVLLNRYRNGLDSLGWHADNEPELGDAPVIASVSLGAMRMFDLRHRTTGATHTYRLVHGSL
ncbi:alpha-ketoglutarate-dependent dioxygenase AlkB, partial [Listeria monocytogenes]|uniref:alpha-ketoglutarate-dependent dioxygenase AlkB n=1 Tax=Listeria monocytogenes TaxID=1639 RepID=UPI003F67C275